MGLFDDIKARFSTDNGQYDDYDPAYDDYAEFDEPYEGEIQAPLPAYSARNPKAESVTVVSRPRNRGYERESNYTARMGASEQAYSGRMEGADRFYASRRAAVYVLKAEKYDQAEIIAQKLKAGHPVALSLMHVRVDVAKRLLDFSFGACCVLGGKVEKLAEKVFVLLPSPQGLSDSDREILIDAGLIPPR